MVFSQIKNIWGFFRRQRNRSEDIQKGYFKIILPLHPDRLTSRSTNSMVGVNGENNRQSLVLRAQATKTSPSLRYLWHVLQGNTLEKGMTRVLYGIHRAQDATHQKTKTICIPITTKGIG